MVKNLNVLFVEKKQEVYSRITGYYRPVKNWNDGKAEEYKNRKVYDLENSCLAHKQEQKFM